ncbi:MAG: hypothetical protein ACRDGQ_08115 [Candidatus Limnocylindrales bacterium]
MTASRSLFAGLIMTTTLVLAGCGSAATAAPGSSSGTSAAGGAGAASSQPGGPLASLLSGLGALSGGKDPAALLTADMASSVLGSAASAVPETSTPITASYATAGGDTMTIFIESIPGGLPQAALNAGLAQANGSGDLQPISGLGDTAGKQVADNSATIAFAKGNTMVVLDATSSTLAGSDLEPKVEAIAQQIAGGL